MSFQKVVRRVNLYAGFCLSVTIHLDQRLLAGSSYQPGFVGRAALCLLGIAPSEVYLATPVTRNAGSLLRYRFTLTCALVFDENTIHPLTDAFITFNGPMLATEHWPDDTQYF